ncbi:MAG: D-alanyl-D-alanine carboxypeptidase family protein, partial [Ruminococcus sp.]|nr:D-alanyl-D-alanine carboxypeptidase family protein [Ruminococcus sp.]
GNCIVTVISKSNPDVKAEIKVKVTDKEQPISISLSDYELDILTGTLGISYVTTLPKTAVPISEIWISSDPSIASVDKFGNIYGVSAGTCTITVSSADDPDISAIVKVNVHNRPLITSTTTTSTITTTTSTTTTTTTSTTTTTTTSTTTTTTPTTTTSTTTTHLIQSHNGATYVDGILIVNKTYSIARDYPANELTNNTEEHFRLLQEDAAKLGLKIVCSSGFRSYDYQEELYNNYVSTDGVLAADTYSARAGHSEHQTGLAIDVNSISDAFIGTAECEWLENNAHKYGFIIRYPKGKEAFTGFRYEPWHIRFLGVETATKVYESGLCLEEYLGIDSYYH